jgi:hypothetical protein
MLCSFLAACGGSAPFGEDAVEDDDQTSEPTTDETIESDRNLPPGTANPQPSTTIFRKEAQEDGTGNGFAQSVSYNSQNDTFTVDNLPFDGNEDTPYLRSTPVGSLNDYAVYEAVEQVTDPSTGAPINQFRHRAIYGVSKTGQTEFAIIRTGAYVGYGFGGFLYERNGTVTLPTTGQALYNGQAAGLRDFEGRSGLEYTTSNVQIAIDFDDFNQETGQYEGAVDGFLFNRRIFDTDGQEITDDVLARINTENDASLTAIPTAVFTISTNALDANGEITGGISSRFGNNNGETIEFESGTYYGIVSGDNAGEIVGIIVTEHSRDPAADTTRETTGFTIYREP